MKNLLKCTALLLAFLLLAVSCIPYGLEYRNVTFNNISGGPVDISYRLINDKYSVATRVYGNETISVCTIYGKTGISVEGPYASYFLTDYTVKADGTTTFNICPNMGLIEVQNMTGGYIYDVSLGTIGNPRRCTATFDLIDNVEKEYSYISAGNSSGIRVPYDALTTTEIGTYYIFFKKGNYRYRSIKPVSLPKNGEKLQMKLNTSDFV